MFYRKKFRKLQELYNSLNQDYLKLRRDYWSLAEELENLQNHLSYPLENYVRW